MSTFWVVYWAFLIFCIGLSYLFTAVKVEVLERRFGSRPDLVKVSFAFRSISDSVDAILKGSTRGYIILISIAIITPILNVVAFGIMFGVFCKIALIPIMQEWLSKPFKEEEEKEEE